MFNEYAVQAKNAVTELLATAKWKKGDILVVGCSSSEICGDKIGTNSNEDAAKAVFDVIYGEVKDRGLYLAAQCCEHLNRALIIEEEAADKYGYEQVNVIPQKKAGGSFATAAYAAFVSPVAVEHVKAVCGIDIGDTLIGMHLKDVAVPVRISVKTIGQANVVCARTRPKFIGGVRACYDEEKQ